MRLGITGGGYVGSCLIEHELENTDNQIVCMDNFHKGNCDHLFKFARNPNFSFIHGDINHEEDVRGFWNSVDNVINTAAIVGFPACQKHQVLAKATHVDAIKLLLKYRPKGASLITCSTDSCYGINSDFCNEETPLNPQSLYGETKTEAEKIVLAEDNTMVLRFSTGMGVSHIMRCNLLVNDFVYTAVTTGKLEVFEPKASRSFINVKDMGEALSFFNDKLCTKQNKYRVYNVGSDDLNYTKGELAEAIQNQTGCKVSFIDGKDVDCRDYKISHDRQNEEGFNPKTSMRETISELVRAVPLIEWQRKYQ